MEGSVTRLHVRRSGRGRPGDVEGGAGARLPVGCDDVRCRRSARGTVILQWARARGCPWDARTLFSRRLINKNTY